MGVLESTDLKEADGEAACAIFEVAVDMVALTSSTWRREDEYMYHTKPLRKMR